MNLRRLEPTSLLCEDDADIEADSSFLDGVQRDQPRKKIEEFPDIRTLNELVQKWIQEAKLQFCSGLIVEAAKVSDSPLRRVLEFEFPKKFSTLLLLLFQSQRPSPTHQALLG